ncbi:MAG: hypothetical protein LBK02_09120 [Treponema sp.]|jgi:two-component system chemotaxis sensor kinase CheA|nr:hypothetical protein [Treponema sp.]
MKRIWHKREYLAMTAIVALFIFGSIFSMLSIWLLRGTARVVNHVGIVQGSTQLLVTRELMVRVAITSLQENPTQMDITRELASAANNREIIRIEEIINELISGEGSNNLIVLHDKKYLHDITLVKNYWEQLKTNIFLLRDEAAQENSQLSQMLFASSQVFYDLLNNAASSAEAFSGRQISYSRITIISATIFSLLIIIFGLFYLYRLKRIAEAASSEITVMKDNLNIGVFLMDKDQLIQPQYSKSLETILETGNLSNTSFTDLLSASIPAKETETLKDYFAMIINRTFDKKMLEDINPINELLYINNNTGEEKNLRCAFALVDRGDGGVFILGTVEDITGEKLLKKQLSEEEDKREEDLQVLFEIIQVEPRVFDEFLEDTEYEFDRINEMLKNKELTSQYAMVDIYQSVHAIKSDAIILGLENFSQKIQALELEIKKIRDQEKISFEDTLHIAVEIEKTMREKDKFQDIVNKLRSFKISDARTQNEYLLVQSLNKASDKAARDLGKKVELVIDSIDSTVLENSPRRIIKEVLIQLVRNAVYHGIESPAERTARHKDETGHIHLSIKTEDGKIHIKLADDGRGIDFNRIREKVQQLNWSKESVDFNDNKKLARIIFSPGFSTAEDAGLHAGRGIGLSLVRDRLHGINGSIKLHTEEGKGTAFHIFIPLEQQDTASLRKSG